MFNQPIVFAQEDEPPRLLRAQALPYPDLQRVWVRVQLTTFAAHPELEMTLLGPDGSPHASMTMVDVPYTYVSLTLHLRQPQPGQPYALQARVTRDHTLLDERTVPFSLVFVERDQAKSDADALEWTERGVAIEPLPPEDPVDLGWTPLNPSPN